MDNKRIIYTVEVNDKGKVKVLGLSKSFENASSAVKKLNQDLLTQGEIMEDNSKKNQNMIDKTGLAGATLVELGRTISDSNYGLRAMANNISQLSTLFITLITTSNGLVNGLGQLLKVAMGPVGLIVAFQGVIALFERADMQASKLEKTTNALADAQSKAGAELKFLLDSIKSGVIAGDELVDVISKVNEEYEDLNLKVNKNKELTDDSVISINNKIDSLEKLALANAITTRAEELYSKQLDINLRKEEALEQARIKQSTDTVLRITNTGEVIRRSDEDIEARRQKRVNAVIDEFNKEQEKLNQEFETLKKVAEENDYYTNTFVSNSKERQKEIKKEGDEFNITTDILREFLYGPEDLDVEGISFLDAAEIAFNERAEFLKQFQIQSAADRINLAEDNAIKELDLLYQDLDSRIGYEEDLTKITEYYANERIRVGDKESEARQRSIREIGRAVSSVGKLLQDVSGENKNLAVAGVIVEKAGAIAQIISNTAIANAKAVAAFPITAGQPFVGINTASAGISIASTIAQASQAIQEIKNPSSGSSGGGAASALPSTPVQAPAFNVVGATQTSQLAQTISQAEDKPIKAFVVASDVSTAQELERSTIEGASIG